MADTVTSATLMDGTGNRVVMHFTNQSDGTGESAVDKVTPSSLSGAPSSVSIMRIKYATQGMAVKLLWDAGTDVLAWSLPADHAAELSFEDIGGLQNNAGSGVTGKLQLTTIGHSTGDSYNIVLVMKKQP